ncbi:hypothetical protein BDV10DRAFT_200212 [Aspergillus recurvatus]
MLSLRTLALGLALLATTATAEHLKVVFSSGSFSAIGDQSAHYSSFAIIRDNGEAIYDDGYPGDRAPCFNTDGGRTFQIEGDCWASGRQFHCLSDFGGSPKNCDVRDANGNVLGTGVGQKDTNFIGISIGLDASCVVEFDSEDAGNCPVDDGNGPLHVTKDNHGDGL